MANQIKIRPGDGVTFAASGGTVALNLSNLGNGNGIVSQVWDRGSGGPWPRLYSVACTFLLAATHASVVGDLMSVYAAASDGTNIDGTITAGATLTTDVALRNMHFLDSLQVQVASSTAGTIIKKTFIAEFDERYLYLIVWNGGADHIQSGNIVLTPIYDEIQ